MDRLLDDDSWDRLELGDDNNGARSMLGDEELREPAEEELLLLLSCIVATAS